MNIPGQTEIPPPSPEDVLYRKDDGFAWITLNRPVVLNPMNWSVQRGLMRALNQAEADSDVRAVILSGAGRVFCSGGDLQSKPPNDDLPTPSSMDITLKIWTLPAPVIAAVKGYAVGQGCELAGVCDLTVAADDAKFGEIQIRHGFGPPILVTPFLLGLKQAKELLMLGDMVDAAEAQRLGLVNRVVPADQVLDEAEKMARKLAALKPQVVQLNKLLVNRTHELAGFRAALDYRSDPVIAPFANPQSSAEDLNAHLKVLREQGWEAFRKSRDVNYREYRQQP